MKTDILKQYVSLRGALTREKAQLESRLEEINQVLKGNGAGTRSEAAVPERRGRRKMSAAGRARISAAAKARWAKRRGSIAALKPAKNRRRKMSAAARAKLSARAKARWAKVKAAGKRAL